MGMTPHGRYDLDQAEGVALMDGFLPPPIEDWEQCDAYFQTYLERLEEAYGEKAVSNVILLAQSPDAWPEFDEWCHERSKRVSKQIFNENTKGKSNE